MPMNAWTCGHCGHRTVIDHEFKPAHCPRCKKKFGDLTEQYESPFADMTEGGDNYDGEESAFRRFGDE